jgi:hypothetical protein
MFKDSNFLLFLLGILPGLIYAFIIYLNSPIRTIRLKPSSFYILFGMLSIFVVMGVQFIFPHWSSHVDMVATINGDNLNFSPTVFSVLFQNFIQIGFDFFRVRLGRKCGIHMVSNEWEILYISRNGWY